VLGGTLLQEKALETFINRIGSLHGSAAPPLKKAEEAQNELSFHTTQNDVCFFQFF
jgi:hypothetical protein